MKGRGEYIHISIASTFLRVIERVDDSWDNGYLSRLGRDPHAHMHDRLWTLAFKPALKVLYSLYLEDHMPLTSTRAMHVDTSTSSTISCCGPVRESDLLSSTVGKTTHTHLLTNNVICYVCGAPCLTESVVVTGKRKIDNKSTTVQRLLCMECFGVCRGHTDILREAKSLTVRSAYHIMSGQYKKLLS